MNLFGCYFRRPPPPHRDSTEKRSSPLLPDTTLDSMWFSFSRPRNRFSIEQFRYLVDHLQKIQIVNDFNKDFVVEALRSIAEIVTYGDQHDPSFFEFFMEKQVMGEFVRILGVSRTVSIGLQLLQTLSIMIQNLKSKHAIYYVFSNEHVNSIITYPFEFRNEELLSYYISFLRAISGRLDRDTISLLVKTEKDEVVSFPLYTEAIKFSFNEENMVRVAVCALTLNVYHVGDEAVNRFVTSPLLEKYFSDMVAYFRKQCIKLDEYVSEASKSSGSACLTSSIVSLIDEIEDKLYYFSDIISSGVPKLERLITDNILQLLVFPLFLPSVVEDSVNGTRISVTTSLFLLCCILRIVKTKDLASGISAALFYTPEAFIQQLEGEPDLQSKSVLNELQDESRLNQGTTKWGEEANCLKAAVKNLSMSARVSSTEEFFLRHNCSGKNVALREILLSYMITGDDVHVLGSLHVLSTLLQTKELDESMLEALGILPQRKQHKKLLLKALVGEASGEEQLFSSGLNLMKDGISSELEMYLQKLKDGYGLSSLNSDPTCSQSCNQVVDALVTLLCNRSGISAETLWHGGWLLRQLLPCNEQALNIEHLRLLQDSCAKCKNDVLREVTGSWCDLLIAVIVDEWRNCKKAIEGSSLRKDLKLVLFPHRTLNYSKDESTSVSGERMCEAVKVFVLHHQLRIFSSGGTLPDQPDISSPINSPGDSRGDRCGLDAVNPKPGSEIKLVDAMPCRIAFKRGKERHLFFLATSRGTFGWILLAEKVPLNPQCGVVRVAAPLAGSNPRIDDKHGGWLHIRIRPSTLSSFENSKLQSDGKMKGKAVVDGRWTLAFRDEQSCKFAKAMILEEMQLQSSEVQRRLRPLLDLSVPGCNDDSVNISSNGAAAEAPLLS